jgi:hypothetical protein
LDRVVSELRTRRTTLAAREELLARETVLTAVRTILSEIATRRFGDYRARSRATVRPSGPAPR